ncbi:MAG: hypothetical protein V1806_07315 [Pseudomonadota bacterium]
MVYVFDQQGRCLERNTLPAPPPVAAFMANHGQEIILWPRETDPYPEVPLNRLTATIVEGLVTGLEVDPAWQPPAPAPPEASVLDGLAELAEVVANNVAASPHDKRFLTQKAIGKQAIAWIKEHPACTAQEAEDHVMGLILAELPSQPVVPRLYWEHQGTAQGLAMSYLYEAIQRGYCPSDTPLAWASLVGLIVATPEAQIAAWLRSL